MKNQSLISKLIILVIFIVLIVSLAVCVSLCNKNKSHDMYETYTVTYAAAENGGIIGEETQRVRQWNDATQVEAVADEGYLFAGWSDNIYFPVRKDEKITGNLDVTATFVSKTKTLKYEYNGATSNNTINTITLNYDDISSSTFVIPEKTGYEFQGWYLDSEYTRKIADKDGIYYLGKSIFYSDADTIYARWETPEGIIYPVLMVFVDDVNATFMTKDNEPFHVYYQMSLLDIKICELIPASLADCLNEAFDGSVIFEFDAYFTNKTLNSNGCSGGTRYNGYPDYHIFPPYVTELVPIIKNYRSIISSSGYNDTEHLIHSGGGSAMTKYAFLPMNDLLISEYSYFSYKEEISIGVIAGCLHEFVHTIEQAKELELDNYHDYLGYFLDNDYDYSTSHDPNEYEITCALLYLKNESEMYGELTGIPYGYWTGEIVVEDIWMSD